MLALLAALAFNLQWPPAVFPWRLPAPESPLFGGVFIGAAFHFGHALAKPLWKNAQGPLPGFLACDAVLIRPLAAHFGKVDPALRLSLSVIVLGALVALGMGGSKRKQPASSKRR